MDPTTSTATAGELLLTAIATDQKMGYTEQNFKISILGNSAPVVDKGISTVGVHEGVFFVRQLSDAAFRDPDGDLLNYSMEPKDGGVLPVWLTFTGGNFSITGTPESGFGEIELKVTANDGRGSSAESTFTLKVEKNYNLGKIVSASILTLLPIFGLFVTNAIVLVTPASGGGPKLDFTKKRKFGEFTDLHKA